MSCGVDHRLSSDQALLWLWCRPATVALIQSLAWEPPYAMGTALKRLKKKKEYNSVLRVTEDTEIMFHNKRGKIKLRTLKTVLNKDK